MEGKLGRGMNKEESILRKPHLEVQRLIQARWKMGAARATVEIRKDRITYSDDMDMLAAVEIPQDHPDRIYGTLYGITCHRAPDGMRVRVLDHLYGQERETFMDTVSQDDAAPPRETPDGMFTIHMKRGSRGMGMIQILEPDGSASPRESRHQMWMTLAPTGTPGEQVRNLGFSALAVPVEKRAREGPVTAQEAEQIVRTAMEEFALALRREHDSPASGPAWPQEPAREALAELGITGLPPTPPTCLPIPGAGPAQGESLLPEQATLSLLPHGCLGAVARAMARKPGPLAGLNLVREMEDEGADLGRLPRLRLAGAAAVLNNGETREIPVARTNPEDGWPLFHERRHERSILERVRSIAVRLELTGAGAQDGEFDLELETYADDDGQHTVLLTTPGAGPENQLHDLPLGVREWGRLMGAFNWPTIYHTRRLSPEGEDGAGLERINRETMEMIAEALDAVRMEPGESEMSVTSPSGTFTLGLRAKGEKEDEPWPA